MAYEFKQIGNDTEEDRMLNTLLVSSVVPFFVEIGPDKFIMTDGFNQELADSIKNLQVRDEDIFLAAYPKTGSTWLHELVFLVSHDFNYNKIKEEAQFTRLPCIEGAGIVNFERLKTVLNIDVDAKLMTEMIFQKENPRNLKTHLYFSLLPEAIRDGTKMSKIIVPLRNPYDVCISFYHHSRLMYSYTGTFEQFCQLFLAGRVYFGHFWKHVKSFWEQRHRPNILFIKYSDMKKDLPSIIKQVVEFLEKRFSDDDIAKAADYLSFDNMKANPDMNQESMIENFFVKHNFAVERTPFLRSGTEGGYKTVMSPEMIKKFDAWIEENVGQTGITF